MQSVVVVGGSLAGLRAAQALRKRGFAGTLTMIAGEAHAPYDRPPLSKQLLAGEWPAEKLFFHAREDHRALSLDLRLGVRAVGLDPRAHTVALSNGESVPYDGLIIATGAAPRQLTAAGELEGVFYLRTLDDARAIAARLAHRPRVAVVGAGFIGLEVASSCRKLGLEVTLIEPQARPLSLLLGDTAAAGFERLHADHGVVLRLGTSVTAFEGAGRVERVRLSDGSVVEADVVVIGIGVEPETGWLAGSGAALARGVLCDATLATNLPDVVAAGDVVSWPNAAVGGETVCIEHWSNAVEQGAAAAARLLDGPSTPAFSHLPYFWSDQYDRKFQCAGRVLASDRFEVVHGALGERSFAALYGRGERLTGVLTGSSPALFLRLRKLLAEGASFEAARRALA
jgi:3-phenylpropionate/trans-cinnamate dioxygenase ferredoxin reductase subunit